MEQLEVYADGVLDAAVLAADTPPPWQGMSKSEAVRRADMLLPGRTTRQLAAALAEVGVSVPESSIRRVRCAVGTGTPRPRRARRTASSKARRASSTSSEADHDLGAVWAAEVSRAAPAAPVAEEEACPECGGPMQWERARTVVRCLECDTVSVPRTVLELAAEQQQRDSERAALAVRADPAAEHRAALELAAERERLCDAAATLIGWLDLAGMPPGQARQLAAGYVGQFRHLTGMAQRAASTGELDAVRDLLGQVTDNVAGQRHIIDTARDAAREPAQLETPGVIDAEWDEDEEEWEDEEETPEPAYRPGMAYSATAAALAQLEAEAARRQRNGVCQIRHGFFTRQTIATREYGPVVPDPYLRHGSNVMFAPNGPRIRCCDRHGADAERAILEDGWTDTGWVVLS